MNLRPVQLHPALFHAALKRITQKNNLKILGKERKTDGERHAALKTHNARKNDHNIDIKGYRTASTGRNRRIVAVRYEAIIPCARYTQTDPAP